MPPRRGIETRRKLKDWFPQLWLPVLLRFPMISQYRSRYCGRGWANVMTLAAWSTVNPSLAPKWAKGIQPSGKFVLNAALGSSRKGFEGRYGNGRFNARFFSQALSRRLSNPNQLFLCVLAPLHPRDTSLFVFAFSFNPPGALQLPQSTDSAKADKSASRHAFQTVGRSANGS